MVLVLHRAPAVQISGQTTGNIYSRVVHIRRTYFHSRVNQKLANISKLVDSNFMLFCIDFCSHVRSVELFAESVNPKYEQNFPAVSVQSNILGLGDIAGTDYDEFVNGEINENNIAYMGIACGTNASGSYFLQTNAESLFGKGNDGFIYEERDDDDDE